MRLCKNYKEVLEGKNGCRPFPCYELATQPSLGISMSRRVRPLLKRPLREPFKNYLADSLINSCLVNLIDVTLRQGGRTWQPFVGSKNGNENFCQARIYNFSVKCVVFARNRKFAKLTQWNMQYIPCNSALLALETLFLTCFESEKKPRLLLFLTS